MYKLNLVTWQFTCELNILSIVSSFLYTCVKFSMFFHLIVLYTLFMFVDLIKNINLKVSKFWLIITSHYQNLRKFK